MACLAFLACLQLPAILKKVFDQMSIPVITLLTIVLCVGILIGGMAFVFALLTALGGFRTWPLHIAIAVISVGGMWATFTYALRVILPRGEWTGF